MTGPQPAWGSGKPCSVPSRCGLGMQPLPKGCPPTVPLPPETTSFPFCCPFNPRALQQLKGRNCCLALGAGPAAGGREGTQQLWILLARTCWGA